MSRLSAFCAADAELLDQVEEPPPVAVGVADDRVARRCARAWPAASPRASARSSSSRELVGLERLEHVNGRRATATRC